MQRKQTGSDPLNEPENERFAVWRVWNVWNERWHGAKGDEKQEIETQKRVRGIEMTP